MKSKETWLGGEVKLLCMRVDLKEIFVCPNMRPHIKPGRSERNDVLMSFLGPFSNKVIFKLNLSSLVKLNYSKFKLFQLFTT